MMDHALSISATEQGIELRFELHGAFEKSLLVDIHCERAIERARNVAGDRIKRFDFTAEARCRPCVNDGMRSGATRIRYQINSNERSI